MTNAPGAFRTLVTYAVTLPLALILGYLLATPTDLPTVATVGLVFVTLSLPLLMRCHRMLLFLCWNMTAVFWFLPGHPELWMLLAFTSLAFSLLQRMLIRDMRFLSVPSLVLPLLFLTTVVLMTMKLTGGFGLASLGGSTVGGRRYFAMFAAIAGFFALTAQAVPRQKTFLYLGLFFLGALSNAIGSTVPFISPSFYFLFLIFPVNEADISGLVASASFEEGVVRFYGLSLAAMSAFYYLLARFGIRGILQVGHWNRLFLLLVTVAVAATGGYRNFLILMGLTFFVVFYLEGLFRSKYAALIALALLLGAVLLVPFANKLPLGIQRSLSFLPLKVDPTASYSAEVTTEWRLKVWKMALPEIPKYFWLGKGLAMNSQELEQTEALRQRMPSEEIALLSGDYHSGPISSLIPFGIWGFIGWVWFLGAGFRALSLNHIYGDPALKKINTFLLAYFVAKLINFIFIFGSLYSELALFAGIVGLSVALNGGIRQPVRVAATARSVNLPIRRPVAVAHG